MYWYFIPCQDTLNEATALLTELEKFPEMETNGNSSAMSDTDTMAIDNTSPSNTDTSNEDKNQGDDSWVKKNSTGKTFSIEIRKK